MNEFARDSAFQQRLDELRAERGETISVGEVAEVVQSLMATMNGDLSPVDLKLYSELDDLARYVQAAKKEIAALQPDQIRNDHIPQATDELDAIVEATEEATGSILDCAEALEAMVPELDEAQGQKITDVVTRVYEACNFQDITGQRVTKVVKTLKHIEEKLDKLVEAFGDEIEKNSGPSESARRETKTAEPDLLNGPQLKGGGATQEEIDALLASFD